MNAQFILTVCNMCLQFKQMTLMRIREDTCLLDSSCTSDSMYNLDIYIHFHLNISGLSLWFNVSERAFVWATVQVMVYSQLKAQVLIGHMY